MVQQNPSITLSSLYSSGQCLLSVLGSIGVILLFAGIPQLIYSTPVNPGSLMTFLLGAILICLMVAGNAFIGYKYRQLVRSRREESRNNTSSTTREDKPPSYDDLLQEDGLPPDYASIIKKEKPPRYEDLVTEVYNWPAIAKIHQIHHIPITPSMSDPSGYSGEMPIVVPIHRNLSQNFERTQSAVLPHMNLAYRSSSDDLRRARHTQANSHNQSIMSTKAKIQQHIKRSKSNNNVLSFAAPHSSSPCLYPLSSSVQILNEMDTTSSKPVNQVEEKITNKVSDVCPSTNPVEENSSQL